VAHTVNGVAGEYELAIQVFRVSTRREGLTGFQCFFENRVEVFHYPFRQLNLSVARETPQMCDGTPELDGQVDDMVPHGAREFVSRVPGLKYPGHPLPPLPC
jgi:hypothetical protein